MSGEQSSIGFVNTGTTRRRQIASAATWPMKSKRAYTMADSPTVILHGPSQRAYAHKLVDEAPAGAVVTFRAPVRTNDQSAKMYAMLTDLARAKPDGRSMPVHKWKALAMDMAGCKPEWERSLDGESVVCVGYKSSRLSKEEMSNVIEAVYAYAAERGIELI